MACHCTWQVCCSRKCQICQALEQLGTGQPLPPLIAQIMTPQRERKRQPSLRSKDGESQERENSKHKNKRCHFGRVAAIAVVGTDWRLNRLHKICQNIGHFLSAILTIVFVLAVKYLVHKPVDRKQRNKDIQKRRDTSYVKHFPSLIILLT